MSSHACTCLQRYSNVMKCLQSSLLLLNFTSQYFFTFFKTMKRILRRQTHHTAQWITFPLQQTLIQQANLHKTSRQPLLPKLRSLEVIANSSSPVRPVRNRQVQLHLGHGGVRPDCFDVQIPNIFSIRPIWNFPRHPLT